MKNLYKQYIEQKLSAKTFQEFKREFNNISNEEIWDVMMDTDESFSSNAEMPKSVKQEIFKKLRQTIWRRRLRHYMKYAAAIVVFSLLSLGIYTWLNKTDNRMVEVAVKSGNKAEMTLPDGTHVFLNAVSKLQYAIDTSKERLVKLSGEAFFEVAHNENRPFKVQVNDLQIEVMGTSFNINTYKKNVIETTLLTGSIKISGKSLSREYTLTPGEKASYSTIDKTLTIARSDTHVDAGWCNDYLIFYAAPLVDVIDQIERWYGVEINLKQPQIANDLLSGSFRNENIQNVIQSLSLQYGFQYEINKDIITIY